MQSGGIRRKLLKRQQSRPIERAGHLAGWSGKQNRDNRRGLERACREHEKAASQLLHRAIRCLGGERSNRGPDRLNHSSVSPDRDVLNRGSSDGTLRRSHGECDTQTIHRHGAHPAQRSPILLRLQGGLGHTRERRNQADGIGSVLPLTQFVGRDRALGPGAATFQSALARLRRQPLNRSFRWVVALARDSRCRARHRDEQCRDAQARATATDVADRQRSQGSNPKMVSFVSDATYTRPLMTVGILNFAATSLSESRDPAAWLLL